MRNASITAARHGEPGWATWAITSAAYIPGTSRMAAIAGDHESELDRSATNPSRGKYTDEGQVADGDGNDPGSEAPRRACTGDGGSRGTVHVS